MVGDVSSRVTRLDVLGVRGGGAVLIIEGTVIRLVVEKLPSGGVNKPVWLWWSGTGARPADADRCWQAFLRRFDVEHAFRLLKQTLGRTRPKLRDSAAADRWTWLVLAAHAQLRLARPLGSKNRQVATRYDVGGVLATGESYTRPAHHKVGTKPRRTSPTPRGEQPSGPVASMST